MKYTSILAEHKAWVDRYVQSLLHPEREESEGSPALHAIDDDVTTLAAGGPKVRRRRVRLMGSRKRDAETPVDEHLRDGAVAGPGDPSQIDP